MKNFRLVIIVFLLSFSLFSCKKEGSVNVDINPIEIQVTPGTTIQYFATITIDDENKSKLGSFKVYDGYDVIVEQELDAKTTQSVFFEYQIAEDATVGETKELKVVATDAKSGIETEVILTIEIIEHTYVDLQITPQFVNATPNDTVNYQLILTPDTANYGQVGSITIEDNNLVIYTETFNNQNTETINFEYIIPNSAILGDLITIKYTVKDENSGNSSVINSYIHIVNNSTVDIFPGNLDTVGLVGEEINFQIMLIPDIANGGELGLFTIFENETELFNQMYSGYNTQAVNYSFAIPESSLTGDVYNLNLYATDGNSGLKTSVQYSIEVVEYSEPEIVEANDITANYISTDLDNTMMFILTDDGVTLGNGNSTEGELAFAWHSLYGNMIVSPNANLIAELLSYNGITYTTDDKKESKIAIYDGSWDDLNQQTISELDITSEVLVAGGNGVSELVAGDIIVFETQDGRKGAMHIVDTDLKISTNLTADFKYQKTTSIK